MAQMRSRNEQLKSTLGKIASKEKIEAINSIPEEDTTNLQGYAAYSLQDELRLVAMLNTLKLQPQFYRSENSQIQELQNLIWKIGPKDPKFVAQAIVYSRCMGEGMRTVNHLAAALVAPLIAGLDYAKRFYGFFDKKDKKGGTIFRLDDMSEIKDAWFALGGKGLPASMRKGFASVLENADTYQLAKYKTTTIDIANLVHPNSKLSKAEVEVEYDGKVQKMKALDAILKGITVTADTWEVAQSEAGQEVAKAVKEGKITEEEAEKILTEAKANNWESLLKEGKLGVLAALRNIRNILNSPRKDSIDEWCKLITDPKKVRQALILPIHFDLAYDIVDSEFSQHEYANKVRQALQDGYEAAIPNLATVFTGKTLVVVDNSGSMGSWTIGKNTIRRGGLKTQTCGYKAGLVAATFVKAVNADVVRFGDSAYFYNVDRHKNVFALANELCTASDGWTNPAAVFDLIRKHNLIYDRIVFISDNEVNGRLTSKAYKQYIQDVCDPYIYGIDLAAYGTTPLKRDGKVQYFVGYGPSMYEAVASSEFNPLEHIDKIRQIEI